MGPLRTFKSCKVSSAIRPLLGTASLIAVLGTLFVGAAAAKKLLGMESKRDWVTRYQFLSQHSPFPAVLRGGTYADLLCCAGTDCIARCGLA